MNIIAIIVGAFFVLIIAGVIGVIVVQGRDRVKNASTELPDLQDLNKSDEIDAEVSETSAANMTQMEEAMSVTRDTKIERKDFINGEKSTSLEDDFGDAFDYEKHQPKKKEPKPKPKVTVKEVNLPGLNNEKKDGE